MDWFQNLALKAVLSSAVRHGLTLLGGVLVERGWVNGDDWTSLAVNAAPAIVAFALSLAAKSLAQKKLDVALDMPAGKTEEDLKRVMRTIE